MKYKQISIIYVLGFIGILLLAVFCVPDSILAFHAGSILVMFSMMVGLEWVMYGSGQRLFVDIFLTVGLSIGILLGLFENPHLDWIITKHNVLFVFIITLVGTFRAWTRKRDS